MSEPNFIDTDVEKLEKEIIAGLESKLNKNFQPGQLERHYCQYLAYRESLVRIAIQKAAILNLVNYSKCPILNEIGELFDCKQLSEKPSETIMELGFSEARDYDISIAAGLQVETKDGKFIYSTCDDVIFNKGELIKTVKAVCTEATSSSNGYLAGEINSILPLCELDYAKNITTSSGGADIESEDSYKERLKLAINKTSTAGAKSGYIYYTKSAHQDIIDVQVESPQLEASVTLEEIEYQAKNGLIENDDLNATFNYLTGEVEINFTNPVSILKLRLPPDSLVNIYPLTKDGFLSDTIKTAVEQSVNAEKIRPLTDKVCVIEPQGIEIQINGRIKIKKEFDLTDVKNNIEKKISEYEQEMRLALAKNIIPSEIIERIQSIDGVYMVELSSPKYTELKLNQYAKITHLFEYEEI